MNSWHPVLHFIPVKIHPVHPQASVTPRKLPSHEISTHRVRTVPTIISLISAWCYNSIHGGYGIPHIYIILNENCVNCNYCPLRSAHVVQLLHVCLLIFLRHTAVKQIYYLIKLFNRSQNWICMCSVLTFSKSNVIRPHTHTYNECAQFVNDSIN